MRLSKSMGNTSSTTQITANYEDIQRGLSIKNGILIHTMDDETILISGTTSISNETQRINMLLDDREYDTNIIIYGKNTDDFHKVVKRYKQLCELGFDAFVYIGGLFEWLLLHEIYGLSEFPIEFSQKQTGVLDILKFAPHNANI